MFLRIRFLFRQADAGLPFQEKQSKEKSLSKTIGPTGEPKANLGEGLVLTK